MRLIHYQTLEAVEPEELLALSKVRDRFNEGRGFLDRIKLWRKSDIIEGLEPAGARWGFTRARGGGEGLRLMSALRRMSRAVPRLTWVIYDEGNGGEILLRGGRPVA